MKPEHLNTRIFLDSGDPDETQELIHPSEATRDVFTHCGFLDGQTTNPSLVAKNPEVQKRLENGEKFTETEINGFYRELVEEISSLIPDGSISIEVYADKHTTAEEMLKEGREMNTWIPNAHIKLPATPEGIKAAHHAVKEGIRVNMTLCFTQAQAAAIYSATKGAKKGDVFLSPFVGRLDDRGQNGISLIRNILRMYEVGDGHVEVLVASVRSMEHFYASLAQKSDIITAPMRILKEWAQDDLLLPGNEYVYDSKELTDIPYEEYDLDADFASFDVSHPLVEEGIEKFVADWKKLIK